MSAESTTSDMRQALIDRLLQSRGGETHWTGRLSSSALSTATAVVALRMAQAEPELVRGGLDWLVANQNDDGGWGDTVDSISNISTTALCWGAFAQTENRATLEAVEAWLTEAAGGLEPRQISRAIGCSLRRSAIAAVLNNSVSSRSLRKETIELVCNSPFVSVPVLSNANVST